MRVYRNQITHAVMVVCVGILLSGCSNDRFRETKDMSDFDPGAAIMDGTLQSEGATEALVYEGTGEVVRYSCPHQGKIKLTIAPQGTFEMQISTPTVTSNCQAGGDWETAKVRGEVKLNGDEMYFEKCNSNSLPPEGLGNYTLTKASGGVSCFDTDFDNNPRKWLQATFEVKRITQ